MAGESSITKRMSSALGSSFGLPPSPPTDAEPSLPRSGAIDESEGVNVNEGPQPDNAQNDDSPRTISDRRRAPRPKWLLMRWPINQHEPGQRTTLKKRAAPNDDSQLDWR